MKAVYERPSDPQLAPKTVLKTRWLVHQEQQQRTNQGFGQPKQSGCKEESKDEITTLILNKIELRMDGIIVSEILDDEKQMKSISEIVEQLHTTNYGENHVFFPEEEAEQIKMQGNMEWTDLRRTTRTVQCGSCLRHVLASWKVRMFSRGYKHGPQKWQEDHRRAKKDLRSVRNNAGKNKQNWTTILGRWNHDYVFRTDQSTLQGWTIEYVRYLDYIGQVDISYTAPKSQRIRSQ